MGEEKLRIKMIAQELKGNDPCQMKLKKTGHPDVRDAFASTVSKQSKPMFSTARNKNKDLLASLSDPGLPQPKRPSSAVRENKVAKKTNPQLKRSQHIDYGVHLQASSSQTMKEANTNEVVDTLNEIGSAKSDKIPVEKDTKMIESDQAKSQLDNSMHCEAVRVDDAIEETKSIDRKCVEEIESNVKKSRRSKVEGNDKDIVGINKFSGNAKNNSKFYEAANENSKMPCRNKSKQENNVEDKNSKMPNLKKKANSDTEC